MDEIIDQIKEWQEKAKILDEFTKKCRYQSMKLDDLMVIKSLADNQSEDITARMSSHPYVNVPTSEYNRLQIKAKKYDEWSERRAKLASQLQDMTDQLTPDLELRF